MEDEDARRAGGKGHARIPRRVWRSTLFLVIGRLWGSACTLVGLYMLAGELSATDFGRFTFYLTVFMLLDSVVDMGSGQMSIQWTADRPERVPAVLRIARRMRLRTGLCGVLLVGGLAFLGDEAGAGWIALASLYPLTHVLELSTLVFKNRIAWSRPVLVRMSASAASLAFVILVLQLGIREPAPFLLAIALGSTLGNVGLHLVARPHLDRSVGNHESVAREPLMPFFRAALPIGLAGLCQQTYFYIDNLFVRFMIDDSAVGHYNVAVRIMSYGIMVAVYASMAAMPWLKRESSAGRLGSAAAALAQPMLALAAFGVGALWPWRAALLGLFGEPFAAAQGALAWLLLAALMVYIGAAFLTAVVASGRGKSVLWISLAGLATNLIGNTILVPMHGIAGAAEATLITEAVVAGGAAFVLLKHGEKSLLTHRIGLWAGAPLAFFAARALSGLAQTALG